MDTYRYLEHCGPNKDDHLDYRNPKEVKFWKMHDPIFNSEKKLGLKNKDIQKIKERINKNIDKVFKKVLTNKYPSKNDAKKYVYA